MNYALAGNIPLAGLSHLDGGREHLFTRSVTREWCEFRARMWITQDARVADRPPSPTSIPPSPHETTFAAQEAPMVCTQSAPTPL